MRIVGFDEFIAMPEGTIYSHVETHGGRAASLEGLYRKGENIGPADEPGITRDFREWELRAYVYNNAGPPLAIMNKAECPWSQGNRGTLFAVYEQVDLEILRDAIGPSAGPLPPRLPG